MSSQSAVPSGVQVSNPMHLLFLDEECPSCGQAIPPDKLEEIKGKIASKERERTVVITTALQSDFQRERTATEDRHREQLNEWQQSFTAANEGKRAADESITALREQMVQLTQDNAHKIEVAKQEAKDEADQVAAGKLAEMTTAHRDAEEALAERIAQAEAATEAAKEETKKAVDDAVAEKLAEAQVARQQAEVVLQAQLAEALAATEAAKAETTAAVSAAVAEKLAEARSERETAELALQQRIVDAEAATQAAKDETKKAVDAAVAENLAEMKKAHEDTEAALQKRVATAEAEVEEAKKSSSEVIATATARATEAEKNLVDLREQQAALLAKNLDEQREILDKDKEAALNAQAAKSFEETQGLTNKVAELQRALEKKSNEELGEGAEVDLFEALKAQYPDDQISRVKRGEPGGDILHTVVVQGRECGTIIYDSKNHKAYRSEHVSKLRVDQIAANADHAVLSTHKFPQGTGQLHILDGVILANPARVVMVAGLLRKHIVQVYTLKLSSIERESKTEALYNFITSERCNLLFKQVDGKAAELIELQARELRWHQNHWKKQGETFRAIQKSNAEIENEICIIIGTADCEAELENNAGLSEVEA